METNSPSLARRKLPIGVQTFRKMREGGYYYVDKTPFIEQLIERGTHYFLSRPRRFGKSLLIDTLKELFERSEERCRGLAIHDLWDWSVRTPVVRLDFSKGDFRESGYVRKNVMAQLRAIEREADLPGEFDTEPERLADLIAGLHRRSGHRVAVLVDEYDKPIVDAMESPEVALENRNYLRGLYSTIKFADASVRFTMLTGVSKFSKVNLFSGLNNLLDITLDPRCSSICGYAEGELDEVFAPELAGRGAGLQSVRHPAALRLPGVCAALVPHGDAHLPGRSVGARRAGRLQAGRTGSRASTTCW